MKFSIIIPTLNEEKFIGKCLISLKRQEYDKKDCEIIVVDGNSSDKTRQIAKKYAKVIIEKRRGIAVARNAGTRYASGDIFIFVDGDTVVTENLLQEMDRTFNDSKVSCATVNIVPDERKFKYKIIIYGFDLVSWLSSFTGWPISSTICTAARKSSFNRVKGFNESMYSGEDLDLVFKLRRIGKSKFLSNVHAVTSMRRTEKWGVLYFFYRYLSGSGLLSKNKKIYERVD